MSPEKHKRSTKGASAKKPRDLRSPFDLTANLHAYVPREAVESCLRFTVRALGRGESRVVLTGPAGIGKTLLLHMVGDRIGDELGVVYLPYAALSPEDLCTWALGRMERVPGRDPIEELTQYARELGEQDKALLMLLDDANTMSLATARWLSKLTDQLDGALRLVIAATDGPQIETLIEALGTGVNRCRLDQSLTLEETKAYVRTRLELANAPESTRMRFDDTTLNTIHRASDGNPRQLHQVASAVLRGLAPESAALDFQDVPDSIEPVEGPKAKKKKSKPRKKRKGAARKKGGVEVDPPVAPEPDSAPIVDEPSEAALYAQEPEPPELDPETEPACTVVVDAVAEELERPEFDRPIVPECAVVFDSLAQEPTPPAPDLALEAPDAGAVDAAAEQHEQLAPDVAIEPDDAAAVDSAAEEPEQQKPDVAIESEDASAVDAAAVEPATERRPQNAALTPPSSLRVFRSVGIIAAALVAMVLARPVVHLNQPVPETINAPQVVATIATGLPQLPAGILQPKSTEKPVVVAHPIENGRRVGPLSVQVNATPWARVEVDGVNFGATPVADIPLLPGAHTFRARMADGRILEKVVEISESRRFVSFE